jgi:DNA-binding XRE family transcriptional regulator
MDKENIRNQLRALRAYHEATQKELGKVLGVSTAVYCYKEKGVYNFTLDDIYKIAKHYNATFEITQDGIFVTAKKYRTA